MSLGDSGLTGATSFAWEVAGLRTFLRGEWPNIDMQRTAIHAVADAERSPSGA